MIAYVADTHAVLWYVFGHERMSERARLAINDAAAENNQTGVSAWTLSEVVYLLDKPGFDYPNAFERIAEVVDDPLSALAEVPVTSIIASRMRDVPRNLVPDPADRIIAATAMTLEVPLITHDKGITDFAMNVPDKPTTIW